MKKITKKIGKWIIKKTAPIVLGASILATSIVAPMQKAQACTGARQVAMGDAGVAACDNSHAVYWNQARLPLLEKSEVSYTQQFGDVEKARYDNIVSFAAPISKRFGAGIQYMDSSKGDLKKDGWNDKESGIKLGAGYLLTAGKSNSWTHAVGASLTSKNIKSTTKRSNEEIKTRQKTVLNPDLSYLAEKRNLLTENDKLSIGVLARHLSGIYGNTLTVRPGAGYSFDNKLGTLTFSFEGYDFNDLKNGENDFFGKRFGLEQKVGSKEKNVALRAGYESADDKDIFMAGIGLKYKNLGLDVAFTDRNVGWFEISYRF